MNTDQLLANNTSLDAERQIRETHKCEVYKKRWLILFLFFIYSVSSIMHWIVYSSIADVVVKYYQVSSTAVDWSSMIYLLLYLPFVGLGSYIMNKYGLRTSIMIGIVGTCIGAWIKVAAVAPDRYWVLMLGQSIVGISQVLIMPVPPKLAAVWFSAKEVSIACSISVISFQVGVAVSFIVPPLIVKQGTMEDMEKGLNIISNIFAIVPTGILPILYFCFDNKPPTPPSIAQLAIERTNEKAIGFMDSVKQLLKNKSFMLLFIYYGICDGLSYAISILLNQIVLNKYPEASVDVGIMGLLMIFAGIISSFTCGVLLSKFNILRAIITTISLIYLITTILLCFLMSQGLVAVYIITIFLGLSSNSVLTVVFELAAELTYPIPEGTCGGLLTASAQIFGIIITYSYSYLLNNINILWANISLCLILTFANILLLFIKYDFKRQAVQQKGS